MTILDDPGFWSSVDPQSMRSLVESFPEQVQSAARIGREIVFPDCDKFKVVVLSGLGGSAISGDLVRSISGPALRLPFLVNRDYGLPSFVDSSSIVIACSYSGNTEETLSSYQQGRMAKACIVCITSGGQLAAMGTADGYPIMKLPGGLPPRAALGYSLLALLSALEGMHVIPEIGAAIKEAAELLDRLRKRYGTRSPESGNPAKILAKSLRGKIAAIYGSSGMMDAVAFRWRSQIEENAKNLAFHHALPEMNHNELVGWRYPDEVLRQVGVVLLRDKEDHPQIQRRFELTREMIDGKAGALHEIWSEGNSRLARVLSSIYLGDFVSLYMAYLNNADPTPVEVIDYLKKKLAASR